MEINELLMGADDGIRLLRMDRELPAGKKILDQIKIRELIANIKKLEPSPVNAALFFSHIQDCKKNGN